VDRQQIVEQLEQVYQQETPEVDFKVSPQGTEFRSKGIPADQAYDLANLLGYQYKQQSEALQHLEQLKKEKEFQLHAIMIVFVAVVSMFAWITAWRAISTVYHNYQGVQNVQTR
jgi:hypothetical protein